LRIENIFTSEDFYEKYAAQTNELNEELKNAKEEVKNLYERWEELEKIKDKYERK
jgi:predicted nuclease with TOPRIM domain